MRIFVHAKAGAKTEQCKQTDTVHFMVSVRAAREAGRANRAIQQILAKHFGVSPRRVTLISGATGAHKVFNIE